MSKFTTTIPVDINGLVRRLPARSSVSSVTLRQDRTGVDVVWENDDFKTPYTVPVEWDNPPAVPEGVTPVSGHRINSPSREPATPADSRGRKRK